MSANPHAATDPAQLLRILKGTSANGQRNSNDPGNSAYVHCAEESESLPEFPVDVFPAAIQRYIEDGAEALNVPADMIAVPLLGFAAAAIGNSRAVVIKPGWIERVNLWLAVIGDPGSGKSPANEYARAPLDALQRDAWNQYQEDLTAWEQEAAQHKGKEADALPPRPVLSHYFTTDATIEALTAILSASPGVAMVRDELVGWVKSHDAYRKGGDRQSYLSLWAGAPLKVDRRGAGTQYVEHPVVPIVGGIQPDILPDLGEEAQRRDGFVERILMTWPASRPIAWSETELSSTAESGTRSLFRKLRSPLPGTVDVVTFTVEARAAFGAWYIENGAIIGESAGIAAGCYAKYPGQVARIALVLHALHHPGPGRPVDVDIVSDAIRVVEYFRGHLVRVLPRFAAMGSTKSAGLATRILRVLGKANGEWMARRELRRGLGNSVPAEDVDALLALLEQEGRVENRTVATGARPRQESRIPHSHNAHMHNSPDEEINLDGVAGDDRHTR
jgi:hypothetical protein